MTLLKTPQEGFLQNGKLSVTVAADNLTVALKTLSGADPSPSNTVYILIGGVLRPIVAALSVTVNAGANSFNAGGTQLATKEIDYFAYLGYNATDGVVLGFSRISYATVYSDFHATATNEKYAAISTIANAAAGDNYVNIGRFAATLSAGAGYTWTVPTFTTLNLIQKPIFETRWFASVGTLSSAGTLPTFSFSDATNYQIVGRNLNFSCTKINIAAGTAGSGANVITIDLPFNASKYTCISGQYINNSLRAPITLEIPNGTVTCELWKSGAKLLCDDLNHADSRGIFVNGSYQI